METETIRQIHKHGSVRQFRPDPVNVELVETLVAAGQRGSTSSNLQTYSVVAVLEESRRMQMASLCRDQDFIRQAPVFLAWCADLSRLDRVCQARGRTLVASYVENFLVAAMDATTGDIVAMFGRVPRVKTPNSSHRSLSPISS